MKSITLTRRDMELWKNAEGSLTVKLEVAAIDRPLPPTDKDILNLEFAFEGAPAIALGPAGTGSPTLGITSETHAELFALWPEQDSPRKAILAQHGLGGYLDEHKDQLILGLALGAQADAKLTGTFRYSLLSAQATLVAGADGSYLYLRPFDRTLPAERLIRDFCAGIRLPAYLTAAPAPGEVLSFEYGGYLGLGGKVAVGYEIKGAPSIELSGLQLSERYQMSLLGSLELSARIAGRFTIETRGVDGKQVRVVVRRTRSREMGVAANVQVTAASDLNGLPGSSDEFLGALLGVNAKNWLNYLAEAEKKSSFAELEKMTDTLAQNYLGRLLDKAYTELKIPENFDPAIRQVHSIVESYQKFDNKAINLFDKYFDQVETVLVRQLEFIVNKLQSVTQLNGAMDNDLAQVIARLTGGHPDDPLSWVLALTGRKQGLADLRQDAANLLEKIRSGAHEKVLAAIALAKREYGLDGLFAGLAGIRNADDLKAVANDKLGGFARRLVGKLFQEAGKTDMARALERIHALLAARRQFQDKLYRAFTDAVRSSYEMKLQMEYSRAAEDSALVDITINLDHPEGRLRLAEASVGDFSGVFQHYDPDVIHIEDGAFTHRLTKRTGYAVNVMGWHDRFVYDAAGMDTLITGFEQHVKTEPGGALTVHTTFDLQSEHERRSGLRGREERLYTNLILRYVGESRNLVRYDGENRQFLLDAIEALSANYDLTVSDQATSRDELCYYLGFARDFGLDRRGATFEQIEPLMPKRDAGYGSVRAEYQVRFNQEALDALFAPGVTADRMREIMRTMVLANYSCGKNAAWLARIAWCYWTPDAARQWAEGQAAFVNTQRRFGPIPQAPFLAACRAAPEAIVLQPPELHVLSALFSIEERMVKAVEAVQALLHPAAGAASPMSPTDFAKALEAFGDALQAFDGFDEGANTIFALFDQMIRLSLPPGRGRASSLKLTSKVEGSEELTKMFFDLPTESGELTTAAGGGQGV